VVPRERRTVEQKRKIAEEITKTLGEVADVKPEVVTILFIDIPRTNVAKSGKLLSGKRKMYVDHACLSFLDSILC